MWYNCSTSSKSHEVYWCLLLLKVRCGIWLVADAGCGMCTAAEAALYFQTVIILHESSGQLHEQSLLSENKDVETYLSLQVHLLHSYLSPAQSACSSFLGDRSGVFSS